MGPRGGVPPLVWALASPFRTANPSILSSRPSASPAWRSRWVWGDEEAQFVIMLTLNKHSAGDQHMRIFSRLARRIMHAEFRQSLVSAESSEDIADLLRRELEL